MSDKKIKPETKISDKLQKLLDQIGQLTALELADLVKALEEQFGVSATPIAVAAGAANGAEDSAKNAEEKTEFTLVLKAAGSNKIASIKAVREIKPELGLKEAKDLVEKGDTVLLENVKKEEAEEAKKKLDEAGAQTELK